jgi:hypothetical protein
MTSISFSQICRSTPFDNILTSIRGNNAQEVFEELRKQTVYDPEFITTAASTNFPLTSASSTLQFVTGSALNSTVSFPTATSLFKGQLYIIANESSASVSVKNFGGIDLFELLSDSLGFFFLQDNSTSNGVWVGFSVSGFATGILSYNITDTLTFSTTSSTDVVITGFTVTPVAGRYAVWYNARTNSSNGSAINFWTVYKGGLSVVDSSRNARAGSNNADFTASTQTVISVNGSQAVDVRVRRTGGTINVYDRTLTLIRLGPESP